MTVNVTVADIKLNAGLTENYLYIEDTPAVPGAPGSFVAVRETDQPGARSHLLSIDSKGNLLHFTQDSSSHSGWRTTTVPVPVPGGAASAGTSGSIFSTVAFFKGEVLNVLCLFRTRPLAGLPATYAVSWVCRTAAGWTAPKLSTDTLSFLSLVTQIEVFTDASGSYVYGMSPPLLGMLQGDVNYLHPTRASFFVLYSDADVWRISYQRTIQHGPFSIVENGPSSAPNPLRIKILNGENNQPLVLWLDQQTLNWSSVTTFNPPTPIWDGPVYSMNWRQAFPNPISRIIAAPGDTAIGAIVLVDTAGNAYSAQFLGNRSDPHVQPLIAQNAINSPNGVADLELCALSNAPGTFALFAIENATLRLWLTTVDTTTASDTPPAWRNLGNQVAAIAVPGSVAANLELFTVNFGSYRVYHLSQNADYVWVRQKLASPVDPPSPSAPPSKPPRISAVSTHATALDDDGQRIPRAQFSVSSDQWVTLLVPADDGMVSWWIGPGATPASFFADDTGEATVMFRAQGLSMPRLSFSAVAPGDSRGAAAPTRWSQGDVIETKKNETPYLNSASVASRLAGNDPRFTVSTAALRSNHLLNSNSPDSSGAAAAVNLAGQWMCNQIKPGSFPNLDTASPGSAQPRSFRLERTESGMRCYELTGDELASFSAWRASADLLGDAFTDIIGDIVNGVKHAAADVDHITLTIGKTFEVTFGNLAHFVVDSIRQAGDVMEAFFVHLAMKVEDVISVIEDLIEWLMLLFGWEDIVHTHKVIRAVVTSMFTFFENGADDLRGLIAKNFEKFRSQIDTELTRAEQLFSSHTFNSFANGTSGAASSAASGNVLENKTHQDAFHDHQTLCMFVFRHGKNHSSSIPSFAAADATSGDSSHLSKLKGLSEQYWSKDKLKPACAGLQATVTADPGGFISVLDAGITDILAAIRTLLNAVIEGAQDIIDEIVKLAAEAIAWIFDKFKQTIPIPIVSELYRYFAGEPLSIFDLLCLIAAVPVTVLYKVFNEGKAPFAGVSSSDLGLTWPSLGSSLAVRPGASGGMSDALLRDLGFGGALAGIVAALVSAIADFMAFSPATPMTMYVSWACVFFNAVTLSLEAPFAVFNDFDSNGYDIAETILWGAQGICWLVDCVATVFGQRLTRMLKYGPYIDTGLGVIVYMIGCATAILLLTTDAKKNWPDALNGLIPQLSRPFRFLITDKSNETAPAALILLMLIDAAVGGASVVTQVIATDADYPEPEGANAA